MKKIVAKILVGLVIGLSGISASYAADLPCPGVDELQNYIDSGNALNPGNRYVSDGGDIWNYSSDSQLSSQNTGYVYTLGSGNNMCLYSGRYRTMPSQPPYSFSFALELKRPVGMQ